MADFDGGFKIAARSSGAGLSRLGGIPVDHWEPIGDTVQTTERLADRAFRADRDGSRFVVYFEAYTRWVESAPWSVLAKSGLLSERERLPTRSLIFILLPQGYREQGGTFRLETAPDDPTQQVWFREIPLWKETPEEWWEYYPGLMALFPLCKHGMEPPDAVAHAATAIKHQEMDAARRADLLTTLAIFGRLADKNTDVLAIIGREQMRDSPVIQEFIDEGKALGTRQSIREVLEIRFGPEAVSEFKEALDRTANLETLRALLKSAIQARRVTQFRKAMVAM